MSEHAATSETTTTTGVEVARTLDESVLRALFPDAPQSLDVPKDVGSMFGARMRDLRSRHGTVVYVLVGTTLALAAGSIAVGSAGAGVAIVVLAAITFAVVAFVQHGRAADSFFDRYAEARGLTHVEKGSVAAGVPLLRQGDKREFPRVLSGRIAGEGASLAQYTYTEVSTDSDGNRTETDYDFTILHARLPAEVAARYAGVYLAPKSLSLGALQDKLAHDRRVQLESAEFAKRYSLRVVDEQDDVAVFELFSPPFIHRLATETKVFWQQRGADLVVWRKGHPGKAADLDQLCLDASVVLQRYREEWR